MLCFGGLLGPFYGGQWEGSWGLLGQLGLDSMGIGTFGRHGIWKWVHENLWLETPAPYSPFSYWQKFQGKISSFLGANAP